MTEAEWPMHTDTELLVEHLVRKRKNRPSDRKFRLLMCAACRLVWDRYADVPVCRQATETVERFVDGEATQDEVRQADYAVFHLAMTSERAAARWSTWGPWRTYDSMTTAVRCVVRFIIEATGRHETALTDLIRDIVGNPFHPVAFSPEWRTDTALLLARQMYDSRDFGAMPILADALQDAGCDNEDILNHCRDANATHVRGCWVVDLVLGKK